MVMGNSTLEPNPKVITETNWTLSQNCSNITLVSQTIPYPEPISALIPKLTQYLRKTFPDVPISPATYALAVANWYRVEDRQSNVG